MPLSANCHTMWTIPGQEFVPLLDYDVEIRAMICATNAIESLNARYRRASRVKGLGILLPR